MQWDRNFLVLVITFVNVTDSQDTWVTNNNQKKVDPHHAIQKIEAFHKNPRFIEALKGEVERISKSENQCAEFPFSYKRKELSTRDCSTDIISCVPRERWYKTPVKSPASKVYPEYIKVHECTGSCDNSFHKCVANGMKNTYINVTEESYSKRQTLGNTEPTCYELQVQEHVSCNCACKEQKPCTYPKVFNEHHCACDCGSTECQERLRIGSTCECEEIVSLPQTEPPFQTAWLGVIGVASSIIIFFFVIICVCKRRQRHLPTHGMVRNVKFTCVSLPASPHGEEM